MADGAQQRPRLTPVGESFNPLRFGAARIPVPSIPSDSSDSSASSKSSADTWGVEATTADGTEATTADATTTDAASNVCAICLEPLTTPTTLRCGHRLDAHCLLRVLTQHARDDGERRGSEEI